MPPRYSPADDSSAGPDEENTRAGGLWRKRLAIAALLVGLAVFAYRLRDRRGQ